ncbi:hypothetical protein [Oerskovia paurometabola]|uniref:hypothetical protein n=1 Tax=Oerskovia paurometabola TaxID=162170 RepID=UPI0034177866
MRAANDALTTDQRFALMFEQDSARQLLANGVHTLRDARYWDPVQDAVLTTLSIGAEKLLKISLGLIELEAHGNWPSKKFMRETWGHGTNLMDSSLRAHLRPWALTSGADYVGGLVAAVDADLAWAKILEALDAYGRSGRFYYLDTLAEEQPKWDSPANLWFEAESICIEQHADLHHRQGPAMTSEASERFSSDLHLQMAHSIAGWWHMVTMAARHGAFGPHGVQFGVDASPSMALPAVPVAR